ncbi:hypothetical protein B6U99_01540 [Candidatus Geothermarchaeota archaeon ex4572_27]|nr:MAG: hypothetical protein B6U99_01540 [Candidatus Geothermarchaeota archaeon ex4572_27]
MAGLLDLLRDREGRPIAPAVDIAYMTTCLYVAIAVLAALFHREKNRQGSVHRHLAPKPIAHYAAARGLRGLPLPPCLTTTSARREIKII